MYLLANAARDDNVNFMCQTMVNSIQHKVEITVDFSEDAVIFSSGSFMPNKPLMELQARADQFSQGWDYSHISSLFGDIVISLAQRTWPYKSPDTDVIPDAWKPKPPPSLPTRRPAAASKPKREIDAFEVLDLQNMILATDEAYDTHLPLKWLKPDTNAHDDELAYAVYHNSSDFSFMNYMAWLNTHYVVTT
jgi:hypothetical protein